jgi:hypothetical protein
MWKLNTIPDVYKKVEPLKLNLQGTAVKEDTHFVKRRELLHTLEKRA